MEKHSLDLTLGEMKAKISRLDKVVFGNGQPGLQSVLIELNTTLKAKVKADEDMREGNEALKKSVNAVVKFMNDIETEKSIEKEHLRIKRWKIGMFTAGIGAAFGIIHKVLDLISKT